MEDKYILITGSTDGIGRQTAIELARKNYSIILHGRSEQKCADTLKEIIELTGNKNISFIAADFSSLNEVKEMAEQVKKRYKRLDVLINNAGVYMNEKVITADGFETTFAVNHLAPFLLTNLLLDLIINSQPARIINVSSIAHVRANIDYENINAEKSYNAYGAYALSKLANILFTHALADKLSDYKVTVNSLHPGVITTKLLKTGFNITGESVQTGAETSVYLADSSDVEDITNGYFVNKVIEVPSELSMDPSLAAYFWKLSEDFLGI